MPTSHSRRRSPRRRVCGGRPGVRTSARQVMVPALRLGVTSAFSRNAVRLRSMVKVWSGATFSGMAMLSASTVSSTPFIEVSGLRGMSLKRREAAGASALRRSSNSAAPSTIFLYDFFTGSRIAETTTASSGSAARAPPQKISNARAKTCIAPESGPEVARDEGLDHLLRARGLRAGLAGPLVLALLKQLVAHVAAGGAVGCGEFLLRGRQHVVVELTLHDEQRTQRHRLAPLEHFLRVGLVNRLPGLEVQLARVDQVVAFHLLGLLPARVRVGDWRAAGDVGHARVGVAAAFERDRVIPGVARAHREQDGDVAAAGAAVDA